ncbi:CLUMA_CG015539, isoform A [Clunio marinus]|uniref:CLUMA_CG015539, isoform A n=1 Tax=Clunio marinus TaxID=568069 RepID=A0A1J1IV53_9DIPT|nr:CLUMA_CG015539, isoform A [Clunio marinus]
MRACIFFLFLQNKVCFMAIINERKNIVKLKEMDFISKGFKRDEKFLKAWEIRNFTPKNYTVKKAFAASKSFA